MRDCFGACCCSGCRTADLLYALFFGLRSYPGTGEALADTFTTLRGWMLLLTGRLVGELFAGFAFASAFMPCRC